MPAEIYEKMAAYIGFGGARMIPELFEMVANREEAEICMAMPGTPEDLAERVGKSVEDVTRMCQELYHKGVAFKTFKTGSMGYKMCRNFIQFHDGTILWKEAPKEFLDLWQKFMEEEMPRLNRLHAEAMKERKPANRIIAVEESIESDQQILDADSAEKIVRQAEALAVTDCTCRTIAHKCDMPLEACLQTDNAARYAIDRGTGRELTQEEALGILEKAEKAGLVHVTLNRATAGHYICNCCRCCCQTFPILLNEGLNTCDPSRFLAEVDSDLCNGCGICPDRCFFGAFEEVTGDDGEPVMAVLEEKCMGCGVCSVTCPEDAITLTSIRETDFIPA